MPTYATNRKALHEYEILEKFEAGIVLTGREVKSVRSGGIRLEDAFATVTQGEIWLTNAHISPYRHGGPLGDYDPIRSRKLLLSKKEVLYLSGKRGVSGLTIVPLKVYTSKSRIKIELGLGRGRKQYDKREVLKKRSIDREIRRRLMQ